MKFFYSPFRRQPKMKFLGRVAPPLALLLMTGVASAQTQSFVYTGSAQTYQVPAGVTYLQVIADGAAGGMGGTGTAAGGAHVETVVAVIPGEMLTIQVGNVGGPGREGLPVAGGYNGGGYGSGGEGSGGGATDIRRAGASTGDYLSSRNALMVAGGGGGGSRNAAGGTGGTRTGGNGGGLGGGNGATISQAGTGPGIGQDGGGSRGGNGGTLTLNIGGGGGGGGYYGGGGGNNVVLGSSGGGGGSSWVTAASSGSRFSVATAAAGQLTLTPQAPLPVELTAFTALVEGPEVVRLRWATATEHNNAGFTIERSVDGHAFIPLTTVAGAGASNSTRDYYYIDEHLAKGVELFYYRLKQVDYDGTVTHSPVRTVTRKASASPAQLLAYPNPARSAVRIRLTVATANTTLQVFDAQGRLVRVQSRPASGQDAILEVASLPAGLYILRYGDLSQRLTVE